MTTEDAEMSAEQVRLAHRLFVELDTPHWVARAEELARAAGVSLRELSS